MALNGDWQTWIARSLLSNEPRGELIAAMVKAGLDADVASEQVETVRQSPIFRAAQQQLSYLLRIENVVELRRALHRDVPAARGVSRCAGLSAQDFFRDYYAANRPVVLSNFLADWPAFGKWSPAYFAAAVGDVEIEIAAGRTAVASSKLSSPSLFRKLPMRAYVDLVEASGESNDIYMISSTRNMDLPGLAPLRNDLNFRDDFFAADDWHNRLTLWFGPKGTVTPLHYDQNNSLFCQIYGEKRLRLISSAETPLLQEIDGGFYSPLQLDAPDLARFPWFDQIRIEEVVLTAGDALFIPAGWWHDVQSRAVSINLSILNFRAPNTFCGWYAPGLR